MILQHSLNDDLIKSWGIAGDINSTPLLRPNDKRHAGKGNPVIRLRRNHVV